MNNNTKHEYVDGKLHSEIVCDTLFNQIVYDTIVDRLGNIRGCKVADFGCGTAPYFKALLERGPEIIYGYDYSRSQLETAKRMNDYSNVYFREANLFKPNAVSESEKGTFDKVNATLYTSHSDSYEGLLNNYRNMFDCLKSNGEAYIAHCRAAAFGPEEDRITTTYYGFKDTLFDEMPTRDGIKTQVKFFSPTWDDAAQLDVFDQNKVIIEVTAYYWSNEVMVRALQEAGFEDVVMDEKLSLSRVNFNDHPRSRDFKASLEKYTSMRFYSARKP